MFIGSQLVYHHENDGRKNNVSWHFIIAIDRNL